MLGENPDQKIFDFCALRYPLVGSEQVPFVCAVLPLEATDDPLLSQRVGSEKLFAVDIQEHGAGCRDRTNASRWAARALPLS